MTCTQTQTCPMWHKDHDGTMIYINAAYEDIFLRPRGYTSSDYLNKDDYAVWPLDIAEAFRANDRKVMDRGVDIDITERVLCGSDIVMYRIIKMQHKGGVFGVAIPKGAEDGRVAKRILLALEMRRKERRAKTLSAVMARAGVSN